MYTVYGMDWCPMCKAVRKYMTERDIPHNVVMLPPGPRGWEQIEELTGRRAVPAIFYGDRNIPPKEAKKQIDAMNKPVRQLTEQELEEIE